MHASREEMRGKVLAPTEYSPYNFARKWKSRNCLIRELVGTGRFELPTPRTPSECSTRLSHVPTRKVPLSRCYE